MAKTLANGSEIQWCGQPTMKRLYCTNLTGHTPRWRKSVQRLSRICSHTVSWSSDEICTCHFQVSNLNWTPLTWFQTIQTTTNTSITTTKLQSSHLSNFQINHPHIHTHTNHFHPMAIGIPKVFANIETGKVRSYPHLSSTWFQGCIDWSPDLFQLIDGIGDQ